MYVYMYANVCMAIQYYLLQVSNYVAIGTYMYKCCTDIAETSVSMVYYIYIYIYIRIYNV